MKSMCSNKANIIQPLIHSMLTMVTTQLKICWGCGHHKIDIRNKMRINLRILEIVELVN